jgi:hypothetical protein
MEADGNMYVSNIVRVKEQAKCCNDNNWGHESLLFLPEMPERLSAKGGVVEAEVIGH